MKNRDRTVELAAALAPRLLAYFARRVTPREDSADLLAETLTIAWRKSSSIPQDTSEATGWMFATAARVLANHRRGGIRRERLVQKLREEIQESSDDYRAADVRIDVAAAIAKLPELDAELIRLVYWEGLSATQAGTVMGVPGSTARLRVQEARMQLARSFARAAK